MAKVILTEQQLTELENAISNVINEFVRHQDALSAIAHEANRVKLPAAVADNTYPHTPGNKLAIQVCSLINHFVEASRIIGMLIPEAKRESHLYADKSLKAYAASVIAEAKKSLGKE